MTPTVARGAAALCLSVLAALPPTLVVGAGASTQRKGAPAATTTPAPAVAATPPGSSGGSAAAAAPAPTEGSVAGLVILGSGRPPKQKEMTNSVDVETCGTSLAWRPLVIGKEGEVEGAVVEVRAEDGSLLASATPAGPSQDPVVDLRACGHWPPVLVVPLGATVLIRNLDGLAHELVASSIVNPPFEGNLPRYRRRLVVTSDHLGREERIAVTCLRHTSMVGRWIVTGNTHLAVTGTSGRFVLSGLPPGRHRVTAWHGELGEAAQDVEITAGETAHVTLVFR